MEQNRKRERFLFCCYRLWLSHVDCQHEVISVKQYFHRELKRLNYIFFTHINGGVYDTFLYPCAHPLILRQYIARVMTFNLFSERLE